jgi:hypothetical protein
MDKIPSGLYKTNMGEVLNIKSPIGCLLKWGRGKIVGLKAIQAYLKQTPRLCEALVLQAVGIGLS